MKRLGHDTLKPGDIVGIEYANNSNLLGSGIYIETLGEYEAFIEKQCLCLRELVPNWFHTFYAPKAIRDFGDDMFIKLR